MQKRIDLERTLCLPTERWRTHERLVVCVGTLTLAFATSGCLATGARESAEDSTLGAAGAGSPDVLGLALADVLGPEWRCDEGTCLNEDPGPEPTEVIARPVGVSDTLQSPVHADSPNVQVSVQALQTNETTVLNFSGIDVSEPTAVAYRTGGSTPVWSMNVFSNQFQGTGSTLAHACTRDYSSWCKRAHPLSTSQRGDPTAAYEINGWKVLYVTMLDNAGNGFVKYYRHNDPCPATCGNLTWTACDNQVPGLAAVDYPQVVYNRIDDTTWVVYDASPSSGFPDQIGITKVGAACSATNYFPNCPFWGLVSFRFPRAAFDSSGKMHIVAFNESASPTTLFHTTFDPATQTWMCNYDVIANYAPATGTSATCPGVSNVYKGIGTALRNNRSANIAIDDISSPNTMLVTLTTASGSFEAQTGVYRSVDGGSTWSPRWFSGSNAYHPQVAFFRTPVSGVAGVFHHTSIWDLDLSTAASNARTASFKTADGGSTWQAAYISSTRFITPVQTNNGCYWGDYEAIAPDPAHSGTFYGWGSPGSASYWNIYGRIMQQ